MKVAKWGNSLAIRLTKPMVEALGVSEGDDLKFEIDDGGTVTMKRELSRRELLDRLKTYRGLMPVDFKFDRDEANACD